MPTVLPLRVKQWVALACILLFFFSFFLQKTNLLASDLGRHITNGRVILEKDGVFDTNLYSYTQPERFAPNHHWLFGVLVYLGEKTVGFDGLTLASAALYTTAVFFAILTSWQETRLRATLLAAVLIAPLITMRFEVRPEALSAVFFSLELWLLQSWSHGKHKTWQLSLAFCIVAALWVNIHIFFSLQALLLAVYWGAAAVTRNWRQVKSITLFGVVVILGSLVNPLGLTGALYPARIFGEYGYQVAENQSILFLLRHFSNAHYVFVSTILVVLTVLVIVSVVLLATKRAAPPTFSQVSLVLLIVMFIGFTARMIRFENMLGLTALPLVAASIAYGERKLTHWQKKLKHSEYITAAISLTAVLLIMVMLGSSLWSPFRSFGTGLYANNLASGQFFRTAGLTGPIFNNFDIGSYLIYALYDQERVFVDNRAEAYSNSFFVRYRAAQEDESEWLQLVEEYNINVIFFNRNESTSWGQGFMISRVNDRENWIPVFVDDYSIIFVKNTEKNSEIIKKYQLPEKLFSVIQEYQ